MSYLVQKHGTYWFQIHVPKQLVAQYGQFIRLNLTVTLAPNPAGTFTPGKAALTLSGLGLLRLDTTLLPNTITATLPRTGKYFVTVAELLLRTGKFKGDYCASVESTQNAWRTFHRK